MGDSRMIQDLGDGFSLKTVYLQSNIARVKKCCVIDRNTFFLLDTNLDFYFFEDGLKLKVPSFGDDDSQQYAFKISYPRLHLFLYGKNISWKDYELEGKKDEERKDCEMAYLGNNKIAFKPSLKHDLAIFDFQNEDFVPIIFRQKLISGFNITTYSYNSFIFSDNLGKIHLYNWALMKGKCLLSEPDLFPIEIMVLPNGFIVTITTNLLRGFTENVLFILDPTNKKEKIRLRKDYSIYKLPKISIHPDFNELLVFYNVEAPLERDNEIIVYEESEQTQSSSNSSTQQSSETRDSSERTVSTNSTSEEHKSSHEHRSSSHEHRTTTLSSSGATITTDLTNDPNMEMHIQCDQFLFDKKGSIKGNLAINISYKKYFETLLYKVKHVGQSSFYIFSVTQRDIEIEFYNLKEDSSCELDFFAIITNTDNHAPFDDGVMTDLFQLTKDEFILQKLNFNEEYCLKKIRFSHLNLKRKANNTYSWLRSHEGVLQIVENESNVTKDDIFVKQIFAPQRIKIKAGTAWTFQNTEVLFMVTNDNLLRSWDCKSGVLTALFYLEEIDLTEIIDMFVMREDLMAIKAKNVQQGEGCILYLIDLIDEEIIYRSDRDLKTEMLQDAILTISGKLILEMLDPEDERHCIVELEYDKDFSIEKIVSINRSEMVSFNSAEDYLSELWEIHSGLIAGCPSYNEGELLIFDIVKEKLVWSKTFYHEFSSVATAISADPSIDEQTFNPAEVCHSIYIRITLCLPITFDMIGLVVGDESEEVFIVYNWRNDKVLFMSPFPKAKYIGRMGGHFFFRTKEIVGHFNPRALIENSTQETKREYEELQLTPWRVSNLASDADIVKLCELEDSKGVIFDKESFIVGIVKSD